MIELKFENTKKELNIDLNENYNLDNIEDIIKGYAGYILPDGALSVTEEENENNYHGSKTDNDNKKGYPEFSNTHREDDTCIRLYNQPNEIQYKQIEKIIELFLDDMSYIKVEGLGNNKFYKCFGLYEEACPDYLSPDEIEIGNWTGYKIVNIIKNYFNKNVNESLLIEATRNELVNKGRRGANYSTKNQHKGKNRFERKKFSRIGTSV